MVTETEKIYRDLQKHLNKQPIGYPATKSGADIRLLKRLFKPEEARVAMILNYKPRPLEQIYNDVKEGEMSRSSLENLLNKMSKNGVIGYLERDDVGYFFNIPLVVGMYEGQLYKLTRDFLSDFEEYTNDKAFGLEFLSTELPQMRTIPVERSIQPDHHVATYDHLMSLLTKENGPFFINECICRKRAGIKGNPCQKTSRLETCLAMGDTAKNCIRGGLGGREISLEEAMDITGQNQLEGLILQPNNAQKAEFICACCGCCCGMLQVYNSLPKPLDFWSTNFYARVDTNTCIGCEMCVDTCQVDAVSFSDKLNVSRVNLNRCLGCGNCVTKCESGAMSLVKKEKEFIPPNDQEELSKIIMDNKKGTLGKAKIVTKLMLKI